MNFTPPPPQRALTLLSRAPRLSRLFSLVVLLFLFSPFAALPVVHGASITVNSTCTINQALRSANDNQSYGGCTAGSSSGRDVITLTGDVTMTNGPITITSSVRIEGAGYTISGNNSHNIISSSGDVIVNNIHLTKGARTYGGAVYMSGGTLLITNSTISNSAATQTGGGIFVSHGSLTVANSTIYNNTAPTGGGIGSRRPATLIHVTITGNKSTSGVHGGADGVYGNTTTINIHNSIIGGATSRNDCSKSGGSFNITGTISADGTCGSSAQNPKLGSLTNGYYPLQSGSPAIGAGNDAYCDDYPRDQRGKLRPATNCDSGSVEDTPLPEAPTNISVAIDELWNWVVTFDAVSEASVYQIRYQGLPYDSRGESCQNKFWCEPYNTFTATRVSVSTWGLTCVEMQVRAGGGNPQNPHWGPWSHELAVRKPLWDCHGKLLNPTPGQGEDRTKTYQSRYQAVPYSYGQPQAQIAFEPEVQAARLPRDQRTTLASHVGQDSGAGGAEGQSFYSGGQQSAQVGGAGGPQSQSVGGGGPQSQSVGGGGGGPQSQSVGGANVQPTPTPLSSCKVTAEAVVNVRDKPNMNGAVLHQLAQYEVRVAKSKLGGWYEIVFPNSGTGWVSADWVATSGDCA